MTVALVALALLEGAVIAFLALLLNQAHRDARMERGELITRIQRPEWIPPMPTPHVEPFVPPDDEFGLVGAVILGEPDDADD